MKRAIKLFLFLILFSNTLLSLDGPLLCEPSLIFPEVFSIESHGCFSFDTANTLYARGVEPLEKYVKMFKNADETEIYRYFCYLRKNKTFAALMTFISATTKGSFKTLQEDFYTEFLNLIDGGIKKAVSSDSEKQKHLSGSRSPMKVGELSTIFFLGFSYIYSIYEKSNQVKNNDNRFLVGAINYLLLDIKAGVDWEGDSYLNQVFNSLIIMKNKGLLKSYVDLFFFYLKGDKAVPGFRNYMELREIGVVKEAKFYPDLNKKGKKQKTATLFFREMEKRVKKVTFVSNTKELLDLSNAKLCIYLDERGKWMEEAGGGVREDAIYNESVKIVEQCPGTFQLPFKIDNGKIKIDKNEKWLTDLAVAIDYTIEKALTDEESKIVLNAALKASLEKSKKSSKKRLLSELLSYLYETGGAPKFVRALFAKDVLKKEKNEDSNTFFNAVETVSKTLF
ncbi:MAG: hypothetical protein ACOX2F_09740 [bacterium]